MVTAESDLLVDKSEGIATLTLNRPERLNALTFPMIRTQLPAIWQELDRDPSIRAIIFTAVGDRAFCSGIDVKEMAELGATSSQESSGPILISPRQNAVRKPVIAAVNGVCAGGGLMFVADADFAIASENATFMNPGVSIGQLAPVGPVTWTRSVPFGAVMRMMLVGAHERVSAAQALQLGAVTEVVPAAALQARAREVAAMIARNSPAAVRMSKRILWEALDHGLSEAHAAMSRLMQDYRGHPDLLEGPRAFAEKRPPRWQDE